MLKLNSRKGIAIFAVLSAAILTGCGGAEPRRNVTTANGGINPNNPYGQGGTACVGQFNLQNQAGSPYGNGTMAVSFTAQGAYVSTNNILAGQIPFGQAVGTIAIGTGGAVLPQGGAYGGYGTLSRTNWRGSTIQIQITAGATAPGQPYSGYPQGSYPYQYPPTGGYNYGYGGQTAGLQGTVWLSWEESSRILQAFGGGYGYTGGLGYNYGYGGFPSYPTGGYPSYPTGGYPTNGTQPTAPNTAQVCVTGAALDLGYVNGQVYGGRVYLYINNTQHGYIVEF